MKIQKAVPSDTEKELIGILKKKLHVHEYNRNIPRGVIVNRTRVPLLEHEFKEQTILNTLALLFFLGVEVAEQRVYNVFNKEEVEGFIRIGMLSKTKSNTILALIRIVPYENYLFICDFIHFRRTEDERVYSPGRDSVMLAERGLRIPFKSTLDLCTGSGIQAILAAKRSGSVTAVDTNPRAVYFANLNLLLNEIDNATIKQGDLYEPVLSLTFDFIIANPPFVISPDMLEKYRYGGERGHDILVKILDGLPGHLKDGGFCQIVTFLHEFEGFSQVEYIREFAEEHNIETLILATPALDKHELAHSQYQNNVIDYDRYRKAILAYLEHLERVKLKNVKSCVITFRNSGRFAFKMLHTIDIPIKFNLNDYSKLEDFFNIDQTNL